ncbi:MAG: hypothetical protein WCE80_02575 [Acidimicrobiia bacterium]
MTVLERRAARARRAGVDLVPYLVVGAVALVVGMLAAYGLQQVGGAPEPTQAGADRGAAATVNLAGLWESGLAQQAAIHEQHLLQGRIEAGLAQQQAIGGADGFGEAWTMRGEEMARHVDDLFHSGLAQSGQTVSAWFYRGAEMSNHLEGLIESGQAQQAAISGN